MPGAREHTTELLDAILQEIDETLAEEALSALGGDTKTTKENNVKQNDPI